MAIVPDSGSYVIEAQADSRLGEVSNDFADLIVRIAMQRATERDSHNRPIITVCGIAEASTILCEAIADAIKGGQMPSSSENAVLLGQLKDFCNRVTQECSGDGETASFDR